MKNRYLLLIPILLFACKSKPAPNPENGSFPVLDIIRNQVSKVDSSLFSILKIVTVNGVSDTSYLPREAFRKEAADFLQLPDISKPDVKDEYTETRQFNDDLQQAVLFYTANDPSAEIRWEQVLIEPGNGNPDQVRTIIIDQKLNKGNETVHKVLLWETDRYFQITTSTLKGTEPEQIKKVKITWNDPAVNR